MLQTGLTELPPNAGLAFVGLGTPTDDVDATVCGVWAVDVSRLVAFMYLSHPSGFETHGAHT